MPRLHESLNEKQSAECSINLYAECDQVNVHVPLSTTAKIRLDVLHTQQHNAAPLRSALCALGHKGRVHSCSASIYVETTWRSL